MNRCSLCPIKAGKFVKIDCEHSFCDKCFIDSVLKNDKSQIQCPILYCRKEISQETLAKHLPEEVLSYAQERATKALLEELKKEGKLFHCRNENCNIAVMNEDEADTNYVCDHCHRVNCLKCGVIHEYNNECEYKKHARMMKEKENQERAASTSKEADKKTVLVQAESKRKIEPTIKTENVCGKKIKLEPATSNNASAKSPFTWNVADVCTFLAEFCNEEVTEKFRAHEIDGPALLSLSQNDLITHIGVKVGVANKIYNRIIRLRQENLIKPEKS